MHHPGTFETKKCSMKSVDLRFGGAEEMQKRAVQVDVTEVPLEEDASCII
jgi:choline/glycine/proline betaine transport protein